MKLSPKIKVSKSGYKKNSPDKKEPFLVVPSNRITMHNVMHPVLGISDTGHVQMMQPGGEYLFEGTQVMELPLTPMINMKDKKKMGGLAYGMIKMQQGGLQEYLESLNAEDQDKFIDQFESLEPGEQEQVVKYLEGGYYQQGGGIPTMPESPHYNVEVEDQETALTPDKQLSKFKGKTHEEGGIKVNLPGGTYVFSEHRKVPKEMVQRLVGKSTKKDVSYADLSKKFPTKPYMDILNDPNSDPFQLEAARLKLEKNKANLETIFYAQEAEKASSGGYAQDGTLVPPTPLVSDGKRNPFLSGRFDTSTGFKWGYDPVTGEFIGPTADITELNSNLAPATKTLDLVEPQRGSNSIPGIPKSRTSTKSNPKANANAEQDLGVAIPLPFETLPTFTPSSDRGTPPELDALKELGKNAYIQEPKKNFEFGIDPKLAGTVMDIGLALSDKLNIQNPNLYDRRKQPLFNRFVDFDDKEVSRMYSLAEQNIQRSNLPQQVKDAKLAQLTSQYQNYQAKVDFQNLQRYEQKRERDLGKLQAYKDANIDIHVQDLETYRERLARVNYLKDQFKAQKKARVVNSVKNYLDYVDAVNYANQLAATNYEKNPFTGKVKYKPQQQSNLEQNLLDKYPQGKMPTFALGNGWTGVQIGDSIFATNPQTGQSQVVKLNTDANNK